MGAAGKIPVSLPDVQGLWVLDAMLLCQLIQEVKQVLDSDGHRPVHAEDGLESVIHKLLQCTLEGRGVGSISGYGAAPQSLRAISSPQFNQGPLGESSCHMAPLGPSSLAALTFMESRRVR